MFTGRWCEIYQQNTKLSVFPFLKLLWINVVHEFLQNMYKSFKFKVVISTLGDLLNSVTRDQTNEDFFEKIDLDLNDQSESRDSAHGCWVASIAKMKSFFVGEKNFGQVR